ncbi:MAG TPA: C-GCAxxG-C-C family protein [bacterium]|nr:C-GCAxxG-C-C family protein [bacterium]
MDEEKVVRAVDRACELFAREGYNCAMAVMSALLELADGDPLDYLALAAPFGAGTARAGLTCGALTGAVMALGMLKAPKVYRNREAKEDAYRLSAPVVEGFVKRMGSALCADITGVDLADKEGRRRFVELDILELKCVPAVELAARLGAEVILSD